MHKTVSTVQPTVQQSRVSSTGRYLLYGLVHSFRKHTVLYNWSFETYKKDLQILPDFEHATCDFQIWKSEENRKTGKNGKIG